MLKAIEARLSRMGEEDPDMRPWTDRSVRVIQVLAEIFADRGVSEPAAEDIRSALSLEAIGAFYRQGHALSLRSNGVWPRSHAHAYQAIERFIPHCVEADVIQGKPFDPAAEYQFEHRRRLIAHVIETLQSEPKEGRV